jgi:tungstate transport system substrate-binding protein
MPVSENGPILIALCRAICRPLLIVVLLLTAFGWGCSRPSSSPRSITLATTTSVQDSGLLEELLPAFQQKEGIEVKVVAVGSGQALALGRRGDADILITHSPAAEQKFMVEGFGSEIRPLMYNDFVVVGPAEDPADLKSAESAADAFQKLAAAKRPFLSRGDDSGTHAKELAIWDLASIEPAGDWYQRAGVGMAQCLRMASEKQIYTLTDRGTFLALRPELQLTIVNEGDEVLRNPYSVILVHPQKHPHVDADDAKRFADFLVHPDTQRTIAQFGVEKFGQPLFHAAD